MRCDILKSTGWCGECYAAKRGRSFHTGTRSAKARPRSVERSDIIMAMVRPKSNPKEVAGQQVVDEVLKEVWPDLHAFLTEMTWDDGKKRITGTVLMFCEDGLWKARLNDRDAKVTGWISGESYEGLMEGVDRAIGNGSIQWRADKR